MVLAKFIPIDLHAAVCEDESIGQSGIFFFFFFAVINVCSWEIFTVQSTIDCW